MRKTIFLALGILVLLCGVVGAQIRPQISEVFVAKLTLEVKENDAIINGTGIWAADQPKGTQLEIFNFEENGKKWDKHSLQRFDLQTMYTIENNDFTNCLKYSENGTMPQNWKWVDRAIYRGTEEVHGTVCNVWSYEIGYAVLDLLVLPETPHIPVLLRRMGRSEFSIYFDTFNDQPHPSLFEAPESCEDLSLSEPSACRSRKDMIAVGDKWVKAKVPYNSAKTYDGYREDCSGFVSAAWALSKPGPTTQQFPKYSHKVSKNDLKEGDILLNAAEHVVLFGGWAKSDKSQYIAYEETRPGVGMVKRATPYPYWYNPSSFLPYRYNSVC